MSEVAINLNAAQAVFMDSDDYEEVGFVGGRGSGKSWVGAAWALSMILRYPHAVGLISANTYEQLHHATLPYLFSLLENFGIKYVYGRNPPWGGSKFKEHSGVLSISNGAQVLTKSLERFDLSRGISTGWWWTDEVRDTKREAYDVVKGGMRDPNCPLRIRWTTTPDGYNWFYDVMVTEPKAKPHLNEKRRLIRCSTHVNSDNLPKGYIEMMMDSYDEDTARQEINAEFVNLREGNAYNCFSRALHVKAEAQYNPNLPIHLACDFNVSPMAWVVVQQDPKLGDMVVDEIWRESPYPGMGAIASAVLDFKNRFATHTGPIYIYGDAAGFHRSSITSQNAYDVMMGYMRQQFPAQVHLRAKQYGGNSVNENTAPVNPPQADRVGLVNARLRDANGGVHIMINPKCQSLTRDLERVIWKETPTGLTLDKSTKTKDRKNYDTHASDALGYWIWSVYGTRHVVLAASPKVAMQQTLTKDTALS